MSKISFDLRVYQLELSFESIKDYYNLASKTLEKELADLHNKFEKKTKNLFTTNNELYCDLQDSYIEYSEKITDSFTRNFYYSFITLIYSFLERSLHDLCMIIKENKSIELDPVELKDEGIYRSKNYLIKLCKIEFPDQSHEWNEINNLNKIRNCVVHADGNINISNNKTKLENIISNSKFVKIKDDGYLEISNAYIESIMKNIHNFLSCLFRANVEHNFYYKL